MLLHAGTNDPIVPVEQTMNFAAAAVRVLGPEKVTLRLLKEAGHGGNAFEAVENLGFVLDWLDRVMKMESANCGREPFRLSGQRSSNR
jgi:dipeptidyl aminopeptidase/acylaminoacyl peptidase